MATDSSGSPPDVSVTATVAAPIDKVWALFRPFGAETADWWKIYEWMKLDAPGVDEVGAVRSFKTLTGRTYKERLITRDDATHVEQYQLVEVSPAVPTLTDIVTTVEMTARGPDVTEVRWSSVITVGGVFKGQIKGVQEETYRNAIQFLDRHFHPSLGKVDVTVVAVRDVARSGLFYPDPYVVVELDDGPAQRTGIKPRSTHPMFGESFQFELLSLGGVLQFSVWDANIGRDDALGVATIDLHGIPAGQKVTRTVKLEQAKSGEIDVAFTLSLKEGETLAYSADVQKEQYAMHIMAAMAKVQADVVQVVQQLAGGEERTYRYARYGRHPQIPDVPLEELPRMVAGLPRGEILSPNKLSRMMERATEYLYSQLDFLKRLETAVQTKSDPFDAYFGHWNRRPDAIADHVAEDAELCRQMVAGVNPMVITLATSLDGIPEELQALTAQGRTTAELVAEKRLFVLDYSELAPLKMYRDMFFYAPRVLVYKELLDGGGSRLNLLGFTLSRNPGANPVYTAATTPPNRYRLARYHLACADNQYHQWLSHLGFAHLAMEPLAIAWHNAFPTEHPIGRLLAPHFRETIGINFLARRTLVSDVAPFTDRTFSTGTAQALQMFLTVWKKTEFFANSFPEQLRARGFDEAGTDGLAGYHFRDDGFRIWNALQTYISEVVAATYTDDAAVAADPVIQGWAAECADPERAEVHGFPSAIGTQALLVRALTTIVFQASAQHSAVNFAQYAYLSYVPNRPDSLTEPMPPGDDEISAELVAKALPSEVISHFQIMFAWLLTLPSQHSLATVDGVSDLYPEITARLQANMAEIGALIDARNAKLEAAGEPPYTFLHPAKVAASVSI